MKLIDKIRRWSYDCDGMCGFYDICSRCDCNPNQTVYKYRPKSVNPNHVNKFIVYMIIFVTIFIFIMCLIHGIPKV